MDKTTFEMERGEWERMVKEISPEATRNTTGNEGSEMELADWIELKLRFDPRPVITMAYDGDWAAITETWIKAQAMETAEEINERYREGRMDREEMRAAAQMMLREMTGQLIFNYN